MEVLDTLATDEINVNDVVSVGEAKVTNQLPVMTDNSYDGSFTLSFSDGR